MLRTRVIPCLLLRDESLVKTNKFNNYSYIGDPVNAIKIYNEKEVDELIILDVEATPKNKHIAFNLISQVASECFMPLTYGGGIKTIEDMQTIFNLGVEKLSINSYAVMNPSFIREAARRFGNQSIVVSMDVKKNFWGNYEIFIDGGRKNTRLDPVRFAVLMEEMGAGELLITSIDRDGTWQGYDIDLIRKITDAVSIPVIACGGAGKIEDFVEAVKKGRASAVAAGSMVVYQGKGLGVLINFPFRKELERVLG